MFVRINRFIAVVINNLEAARNEQISTADLHRQCSDVLRHIEALKEELTELQRQLRVQTDSDPSQVGAASDGSRNVQQ